MTRQQWISENRSFYHITHTENLQNIYELGLQNRNGRGICVVRTNHERIVRFICEMMLVTVANSSLDFSIIEIKPSQINLRAMEILPDHVVECTNPLHNYIRRKNIQVLPTNITGTFHANRFGIPNVQEYAAELRRDFVLEQLT